MIGEVIETDPDMPAEYYYANLRGAEMRETDLTDVVVTHDQQ